MDVKRTIFVLAASLAVSPFSMVCAEDSIFNRVMTVEDPGLAECLRVAMERVTVPRELADSYSGDDDYQKLRGAYEGKRSETIRAVTESYAQIRLYDLQIEQIDKRLDTASLPEGLSHELVIAKAELEMKRTMELARLRATMGVFPRYAFAQQSADQLNGWIVLDVVDANQVCIFRYEKPFDDYTKVFMHPEFLGFKSGDQVRAYMVDLLGRREGFPWRIEILRTTAGDRQAVHLHEELLQMIGKRGAEMDVDLRMEREIRSSGSYPLVQVRKGQVLAWYRDSKKHMYSQGGNTMHVQPGTFDSRCREYTRIYPGSLPIRWTIQHDPEGKALAAELAEQIKTISSQMGVSTCVSVTLQEVTDDRWE